MATRQPRPIADVTRRSIETVVRNRELIEQRHEQIFKAASRIFISRGYHRATVREIAEEAGLSLGSLYSYIRTKEDILYLVFDKLTTTLRENIRRAIDGIKDPVEQMRAALQADIRTTEQYQDEILLMYQETKSLDRQSLHAVLNREADYVRFFEDILRLGYERGVFKGDPRLSADIITYLMFDSCLEALEPAPSILKRGGHRRSDRVPPAWARGDGGKGQ